MVTVVRYRFSTDELQHFFDRFWSWLEMHPKILKLNVSLLAIYNLPFVEMKNWTRLSKQLLLVAVSISLMPISQVYFLVHPPPWGHTKQGSNKQCEQLNMFVMPVFVFCRCYSSYSQEFDWQERDSKATIVNQQNIKIMSLQLHLSYTFTS